jgi:predicted CopG family antitoxin
MKTITISDDAYRKLESMKSGRSFSETIEGLISSSVSSRIDRLLGLASFATGKEDELAGVVDGIRKRARARSFETPT